MNIGEVAIRGKTITLVFAFILLVGGLISYSGLGRLEDPEFTVKDALIVTPYPGATAQEVEEEVSDEIERAAQSLKQIDYVRSRSEPGLSILTVTIKNNYDKHSLPQVWDELRRKVGDAQRNLPPGAGPSLVNDDFGDVYGVFIAISGDEYAYAELEQYAEAMQKELLLVQDVAKVELVSTHKEAIFIETSREKSAQFGVSPQTISEAVRQKNVVSDAGRVEVGPDFIRFDPTGAFANISDFEEMLLASSSGALVRLGDIATVRREYLQPPQSLLRVNGKRAIGLAISTVPDGNVVTMGQGLQARATELEYLKPHGVEFSVIAMQSQAVVTAIDGFVVNLAEAVAIVIVVLLVFMGLRSGLIIGGVLILTISGTFILMDTGAVMLERISLGALVIALGMLVDNAIVVVDGTLIGMQKGEKAETAAAAVVKQTAVPLLIATIIAILSFAAIGTSQDSTGEYCRSLYSVLLYSLSLSWLTAVTVTPVLCVMFLKVKPPKKGEAERDPYDSGFYRGYRGLLTMCLKRRALTTMVLLGVLGAALFGFGQVKQSFFPDSTRPQFMVDYWMPRGTHIEDTTAAVAELEQFILEQEGVTQVATTVGKGAPRFLLTYAPEKVDSGYAQLFIDVENYRLIPELDAKIQEAIDTRFTAGTGSTKLFMLGPGEGGKVQVRVSGPDPNVLRELSTQVENIMHANNARGVRNEWRDRVKVVRPVMAEEQARQNGIERRDVSSVLLAGYEGQRVGVYREGDDLLPIVSRAPEDERADVADIANKQIWSRTGKTWIPLSQVVSDVETVFVDDLINRRDRKRTNTIHADPRSELASEMLKRVMPQVQAIELPQGYDIVFGGEYESSGDAQTALVGSVILFGILMVLMTILLFNALRQPLVIWLCVPLSIIGVSVGLLATGNPFGFMSLLGLLSLVGMLIKNAIVLLDETDLQIKEGKPRFAAILDAGTSRVRPVSMAALTTMLGMIPLFSDAFFVSMAVTIVFGLGFATVLTLLIVPVFYGGLFRIKPDET
jgi:multidrug efflux pump subunit AcrB